MDLDAVLVPPEAACPQGRKSQRVQRAKEEQKGEEE
jgi:hypothetical protein